MVLVYLVFLCLITDPILLYFPCHLLDIFIPLFSLKYSSQYPLQRWYGYHKFLNIFLGYYLGIFLWSFRTHSTSSKALVGFKVSLENSAIILIDLSFCVAWPFSLASFNILSCSVCFHCCMT